MTEDKTVDTGDTKADTAPPAAGAEIIPLHPSDVDSTVGVRVTKVFIWPDDGVEHVVFSFEGREPIYDSLKDPQLLIELLGSSPEWIRNNRPQVVDRLTTLLVDREVPFERVAGIDRWTFSARAFLRSLVPEAKLEGADRKSPCACGKWVEVGTAIRWHKQLGRVVACVNCEPELKDMKVLKPDPDRASVYLDAVKPTVITEVWAAVKARMAKVGLPLYIFGMAEGETRGTPAYISHATRAPLIDVVGDLAGMAGIVCRSVRFEASRGKDGGLAEVNAPRQLIEDMCRFPDASLPPLKALVRVPVVLRDGQILTQAGCDERSGIYLAPTIKVPAIPEQPTKEDLDKAKKLILDELLFDFPLVQKQGGQAGAVGMLLLPFARDLFDGPTPLHVLNAPASRTGKSLLAKVIQIVATGTSKTNRLPKSEDQIGHRLTTLLRKAPSMVVFDNVRGKLESEALEAVLTSDVYQDRLLRTNDEVSLPNRTTWVMTANNAELGEDIAGRSVTINLDAQMRFPGMRKVFRHKRIATWAVENRADLVWAALVIIRSWYVAGRPADDRVVLGGFEDWAATIGGILKHVGIDGLPRAIDASRERDDDAAQNKEFLIAWRDVHGLNPVTHATLAALAEARGLYERNLARVQNEAWKGRRMAMIVRHLKARGEYDLGGLLWVIKDHEKDVNNCPAVRLEPLGPYTPPTPPPLVL